MSRSKIVKKFLEALDENHQIKYVFLTQIAKALAEHGLIGKYPSLKELTEPMCDVGKKLEDVLLIWEDFVEFIKPIFEGKTNEESQKLCEAASDVYHNQLEPLWNKAVDMDEKIEIVAKLFLESRDVLLRGVSFSFDIEEEENE